MRRRTYRAARWLTAAMAVSAFALADPLSGVAATKGGGNPQPTTLSTQLSGGSGEHVTVPEGTAVSDAATLSGEHALIAKGTVTYKVYSDSECNGLVAEAGTVSVSAGAIPESSQETLGAGSYYWQASYSGDEENEPSTSACGSEIETVTPAVAPEGPSVDAEECFTLFNRKTNLTTKQPGDLILAFVGANGPSSGGQTVKVKGGGLTWSLVKRENGQLGDAEVWEARAKGVLHHAAIAAKTKLGFDVTLNVVAFKNAPGVGAVAAFNAPSGAPHGSLMTTAASSWVWAIGNDWAASTPHTAGPGQRIVGQVFDTVGDTYWLQRTESITPTAGTNVEINDIEPTSDPYNLVLVEVL